jgi:hypothetical protein
MKVFSYYVYQNIPKLVRRPWWNFWGRDKLEFSQQPIRRVFTLTDSEAIELQHIYKFRVFPKILDGERFQLEEDSKVSEQYQKTTATPVRNLCHTS